MDTPGHSSGLFWIETPTPGRLAIVRRPLSAEAIDDAVARWLSAGIDTVVCLLPDVERRNLGLQGEAEACRAAGMTFVEFPIEDFSVPASMAQMISLLRQLGAMLRQGKSVGIHCFQGIGRSGLLVSCLLVAFGVEPVEAFHIVTKSRGMTVPETLEQRRWIIAASSALRALAL